MPTDLISYVLSRADAALDRYERLRRDGETYRTKASSLSHKLAVVLATVRDWKDTAVAVDEEDDGTGGRNNNPNNNNDAIDHLHDAVEKAYLCMEAAYETDCLEDDDQGSGVEREKRMSVRKKNWRNELRAFMKNTDLLTAIREAEAELDGAMSKFVAYQNAVLARQNAQLHRQLSLQLTESVREIKRQLRNSSNSRSSGGSGSGAVREEDEEKDDDDDDTERKLLRENADAALKEHIEAHKEVTVVYIEMQRPQEEEENTAYYEGAGAAENDGPHLEDVERGPTAISTKLTTSSCTVPKAFVPDEKDRNDLELDSKHLWCFTGTVLGTGSFSNVYPGRYERRKVAVKRLKSAGGRGASGLTREELDEEETRFLSEAALMARCGHSNIVEIIGFISDPDAGPTIVMEVSDIRRWDLLLWSRLKRANNRALTLCVYSLDRPTSTTLENAHVAVQLASRSAEAVFVSEFWYAQGFGFGFVVPAVRQALATPSRRCQRNKVHSPTGKSSARTFIGSNSVLSRFRDLDRD